MAKKDKKTKNQDIIDFRYWLINQMHPGAVPDNANVPFVVGKKGYGPYEKAVLEEVLIAFNSHFGTRGYDIG